MIEEEFYQQCAIAAMQGLQESGSKLSLLADLAVEETAKLSFDMADAMLKEYIKRNNLYSKTKTQVDKAQIISKLEKMFDVWIYEENKAFENGIGYRGVDGSTTTDVDKLFNQLMCVI